MNRILLVLLLTAGASSSGCAVCQSCYDYYYPAYGGIWQRTDPIHGRVGSAFAPAGGPVSGPAPTEAEDMGELVPTPMPEYETEPEPAPSPTMSGYPMDNF